MNVGTSTRRKAVLGIYNAFRKPKGGRLSVIELEREWKGTGLRRSDLHQALKEMTQRHLLQLKRSDWSYELTYLGDCAMHLLMTDAPLLLFRDWLTLRRAKLRVSKAALTGRNFRLRRATDQLENLSQESPASSFRKILQLKRVNRKNHLQRLSGQPV